MAIIKSSEELNMLDAYKLTKSPEIMTVKQLADNEVITVSRWAFYTDKNSKGEPVDLLALETDAGEVYAAQSPTFIRSFEDILDIAADMNQPQVPVTIKKISGTAKSGREYINCVLVGF